jgi:uncharacterized membrane protein SpoIIM required for sporulation
MAATEHAGGQSVRSKLAALHGQAQYTRWIRIHMVVALLTFVVGGLVGWAILSSIPLEQLSQFAPDASVLPELTFWGIFSNNMVAMSVLMLGALTFGLLSLFGLFLNGLIVGAIVPVALDELSMVVLVAYIAPHGIIEIPALLMAGSIGLRVPHRIVRYLLGYDDTLLSRVELYELATLFVVLVVMIAVAAYIEVNITPQFAESLQ